MYGRAGRIGIAVLDSDLTIEPDLRRLLPEGVEIHAARVRYPRRVTPENMAMAAERAMAALEDLLPVRPAALAWACTSGSFYAGREGNARLVQQLEGVAGGIPVTTASSAVVAALQALGVRRPAVGAPYSEAMNARLKSFLEESGFEPVAVQGYFPDEVDDYSLQDVEEEDVARFIMQLDCPECDGIILSCTGLPTARIVPEVERRVGKPIVTSNLAILWHCWRLGGLGSRPTANCRLIDTLEQGVGGRA
jgi:maleate cis-trans isomerase